MNAPKIAVAVFVENAGWGGDVAAPIAALVAERYIKGRTESKWLAERLRAARYLPPIGGVRSYRKPAPAKKDTTSRQRQQPVSPPAPKPMLTTIQPTAVSGAGAHD